MEVNMEIARRISNVVCRSPWMLDSSWLLLLWKLVSLLLLKLCFLSFLFSVVLLLCD